MKDIVEKIKKANFVWIMGNGGSASTANHFANDLVKMCGVKAISLCANEAVVMAYANDNGYADVFSCQLDVFAKKDDLIITISGSGTSLNIVEAQAWCLNHKANYVAFPTMKQLKMDMQRTEDFHLKLVHDITDLLQK